MNNSERKEKEKGREGKEKRKKRLLPSTSPRILRRQGKGTERRGKEEGKKAARHTFLSFSLIFSCNN